MKTIHMKITVTREVVEEFESIFGQQRILPPTFPMVFYQYLHIPWQSVSPPILGKQHCSSVEKIIIGNSYDIQLNLDVKRSKVNRTYYTETLVVIDQNGKECARCVSHLFTKSPLQMNK